jgi:hypothetical protein
MIGSGAPSIAVRDGAGLALDIALQGHLLPPLVSGPTDQRLA